MYAKNADGASTSCRKKCPTPPPVALALFDRPSRFSRAQPHINADATDLGGLAQFVTSICRCTNLTIARGPDVKQTTSKRHGVGSSPLLSLVSATDELVGPSRHRRSSLVLLGLLAALAGFMVRGPGQPTPPLGPPMVLSSTTQRVSPGQSIQAAIDATGPGSTIVVASGVHQGQSIVPADNMIITGEAGAVLDGAGASLPYAVYGAASNVTISQLEIRNYTKPIWGPNNYRHQGAIHGANMNSGGGFIAIAKNWRIENNNIHHNAGWGVSPGDGFDIVQNVLHHNGMAGIGGGDFNGGLFEKNDIYSNNDPSNSSGDFNYDTGRPWDWAWNAAGIKVAAVNCRSLASTGSCSSGTPLVIRSNTVHDNRGVGIWCDINCNDVTIEKNLVERNTGVDSIGIFYEISQNGVIRDNVVRDQGSSGDYINPSGILVWSSDGVLVERNQVEGTKNAIVGNARPREFNRTLRNLTVTNNVVITRGQPTRVGIATDTASDFKSAGNTFNNNFYDDQSKMTFWWTDISRGDSSLSLDQWRALGFTPATSPAASPSTPAVVAPASPVAPIPAAPKPAPATPVPAAPKPAAPTPTATPKPAAPKPATPTPTPATPSAATPASTNATPTPGVETPAPATPGTNNQDRSSNPVAGAAPGQASTNGAASPLSTEQPPEELAFAPDPGQATTNNSTPPASTPPSSGPINESSTAEPMSTPSTPTESDATPPVSTPINDLPEDPADDSSAAVEPPADTGADVAPELGLELGVRATNGPPTEGSGAARAMTVFVAAIAGLAIWLLGRSGIHWLSRPTTHR